MMNQNLYMIVLEKKNIMFKLIYKMTKDGKDTKYFHEKCDKKEQHYVYLK